LAKSLPIDMVAIKSWLLVGSM